MVRPKDNTQTLPDFLLLRKPYWLHISLFTKSDSLWSSKSIPLLPSVSWLHFVKNIKCTTLLCLLILWDLPVLLAADCPFTPRFAQLIWKLCSRHLPLLNVPRIQFNLIQEGRCARGVNSTQAPHCMISISIWMHRGTNRHGEDLPEKGHNVAV